MTRTEHLLAILIEECAEVAQRCTKALRFGLNESQDGYASNAKRIEEELTDLLAVVDMLEDGNVVMVDGFSINYECARKKREKVERYLVYSKECGTLGDAD